MASRLIVFFDLFARRFSNGSVLGWEWSGHGVVMRVWGLCRCMDVHYVCSAMWVVELYIKAEAVARSGWVGQIGLKFEVLN
jgi:hypothetical protein